MEGERDTKQLWKFMNELVTTYGVDGMSSDESEDNFEENIKSTVYNVRVPKWRRKIEKYMDLIDAHQHQVVDGRGSLPRRRRRDPGNKYTSERPAPEGLPRSCYDEEWLQGPTIKQRMVQASVSAETFQWWRLSILAEEQ